MHDRFKALVEMAEKLRSDTGCPWDREQSIASMREHILEEADEVAQAIEQGNLKGDWSELKEELGDLLFNMVMITQMAKEGGHFDMKGVLEGIEEKIISRHTWVFGTDKAETAEEALALWLKNKAKEKAMAKAKKSKGKTPKK